jgi:predicted metal-dependent enzyme (double-stranded beta helix superfamily)
MTQQVVEGSVRSCAKALVEVIDAYALDLDAVKLREGLLSATRQLVRRPDLLTLGVKRQANHIDNSRYLFYDGQICLTLDEFPKGKHIPPHDHGIWEALVVCAGSLEHTVYKRVDDGQVTGHARLDVVEDVVMVPGEITMVVPPGDIHSFKAVEDQTFVITIVGGEYAPKRHYYNTSDHTYMVRTPKALRESGLL